MRIDIYVCENCKTRTDDAYTKGWVLMQDGLRASVSLGREHDGPAITAYKSISGPVNFCSLECLTGFFERAVLDERKKRRKHHV